MVVGGSRPKGKGTGYSYTGYIYINKIHNTGIIRFLRSLAKSKTVQKEKQRVQRTRFSHNYS